MTDRSALRERPSRARMALMRLLVFELVFLVDLLVVLVHGRGLVAAERSRHRLLTRGIRIVLHGARGDFLAGDGGGLADQTPRGAAHQVDVNVGVVIDGG